MMFINQEVANFLRKIIDITDKQGDYFIPNDQYARFMLDEREFRMKRSASLSVEFRILQSAVELANRYKVPIPSSLLDDPEYQERVNGFQGKSNDPRPFEWTPHDAPFFVEDWETLGKKQIEAAEMSRHFFITGETGSGKTVSGVKPLLKSVIEREANNNEKRASALVIDPKYELSQYVEVLNKDRPEERIIHLKLTSGRYRINAYEGQNNPSPEEILDTVTPLSKNLYHNMASVASGNNKDPYWTLEAINCIKGLIDILLYCYRRPEKLDLWSKINDLAGFNNNCDENNNKKQDSDDVWNWGSGSDTEPNKKNNTENDFDLWESTLSGNDSSYKSQNYSKIFLQRLQAYNLKYDCNTFFAPLYMFLSCATSFQEASWKIFRDACDNLGVPVAKSSATDVLTVLSDKTYTSLMSCVLPIVKELSAPTLNRHVSLNPIELPENTLSISDSVEDGKVLIYSPASNTFTANAIGRLIKKKFFYATLNRINKERPVAYICDEFQRFITGDSESGEQAFLDRCRSFRAICVLATQSIASITKSLIDIGEHSAEYCVSIILNNTGTKLFFRNTDLNTQERLQKMIPGNPISLKPHVMNERPISTLKVGECYHLSTDGKWGRTQVVLGGSELQNEAKKLLRIPPTGADNRHTQSVHRLDEKVSVGSILRLCDEIDTAVNYFHFKDIKIEICSPGGSVQALMHYIAKLRSWRKKGVSIETVALMSVSSAAAIILALGDVGRRSSYSFASLLFHNSRISTESMSTEEELSQIAIELNRIDKQLLAEVANHVYNGVQDMPPEFINLQALCNHEVHGIKMGDHLSQLGDSGSDNGTPLSYERYENIIKELFRRDIHIDAVATQMLGLIDWIVDK